MSPQTTINPTEAPKKFKPYVPENMEMREFTFRAVMLGLVMTGILGAANAYLGLKAGMTIAATYPAAVIGMSLLRLMKGSLLEENIARTVGAIGESVAAGAMFTIPAFVLAGLWPSLSMERYWQSVALMVIGGLLGISVRHAAAAGDGGRSGVALSRVGGGGGNSQSGAAGIEGSENSFCQHGLRRADVLSVAGQFVLVHEKCADRHSEDGDGLAPGTGHGRADASNRWNDAVHFARSKSRLSGRGLYYRASIGFAELCRRRSRVGIAGSAPHLFSWADPAANGRGRKPRRVLGRDRFQRMVFDRASDCGWRHAGRRGVHAFSHAQAVDGRHEARAFLI